MDNRRFLLAVVLMIAVMVVTNILLPPPPAPSGDAAADSLVTGPAAAPAPGPGAAPDTPVAGPASQPALTGAPAAGQDDSRAEVAPAQPAVPEDTVVVSSPLWAYGISTYGGSLVQATLLQHPTLAIGREGQPVELTVDSLPPLFSYRLRIGTREIDLATLPFTPTAPAVQLEEGQSGALELVHEGTPSVRIAYGWNADQYITDVRMVVGNTGGETPQLLLTLPPTLRMNEATDVDDERALAYVYNGPEGIERVNFGSVKSERVDGGPLRWAAVKNKYFVAAALTHPQSPVPFGGIIARPQTDPLVRDLTATLLPAEDGTFAFRIYAGPQEPQRLAQLPDEFGNVNPFGWRLFRPFLQPLGHAIQWALYGMHDILGVGYGWVLILFGVIIRLLMWPLNAKAMRSQMKNMEIQPLMKEIQAKYKNDPQRMQQELLKLYKEKGFSPMSGCLPMLIPMPILITLFFVFQSTIAFRGVEFLWLPDLSQKDPFYILPIVLGVSMFLMQWLSSRSMTEQNPQMKMMMYVLPVFMTVIFLNFASGLNLYYAAMNFASIPQSWQIMQERKRYQAGSAGGAGTGAGTREAGGGGRR